MPRCIMPVAGPCSMETVGEKVHEIFLGFWCSWTDSLVGVQSSSKSVDNWPIYGVLLFNQDGSGGHLISSIHFLFQNVCVWYLRLKFNQNRLLSSAFSSPNIFLIGVMIPLIVDFLIQVTFKSYVHHQFLSFDVFLLKFYCLEKCSFFTNWSSPKKFISWGPISIQSTNFHFNPQFTILL